MAKPVDTPIAEAPPSHATDAGVRVEPLGDGTWRAVHPRFEVRFPCEPRRTTSTYGDPELVCPASGAILRVRWWTHADTLGLSPDRLLAGVLGKLVEALADEGIVPFYEGPFNSPVATRRIAWLVGSESNAIEVWETWSHFGDERLTVVVKSEAHGVGLERTTADAFIESYLPTP